MSKKKMLNNVVGSIKRAGYAYRIAMREPHTFTTFESFLVHVSHFDTAYKHAARREKFWNNQKIQMVIKSIECIDEVVST